MVFAGLPTGVVLRIEVTARTTEGLESGAVTLTKTLWQGGCLQTKERGRIPSAPGKFSTQGNLSRLL